MTELRAILAALARSAWNLGWRFSRAKSLLWRALLTIGGAAFAIWRLEGQVAPGSPLLPLSAIAVQTGLFALLQGFMKGREQLFSHRSAALFHLSPAPSGAILGGRLLITVPGRLVSASLLTLISLRVLPVDDPLLWAPLLLVAGLLSGLLGQLAGNLGLIGWTRLWPKTIELASLIGLLGAVLLMWGIIWLVAAGAPLNDLAALLVRGRDLLLIGLGITILLPGLSLGLMLLLRPAWVGDLYRSAYLALSEAEEAAHRPRHSWLPRPFASPAWAIGMKEWRQFTRNRLNLFRTGMLLLLVGALFAMGGALRERAVEHGFLIALVVGVAGTWVVFAEVVAALFAADEERAELFILGALHPMEYIGGKLLGSLPLAVLAGALSGLAGWRLGGPALILGGLGTGIFLGMLGAVLGPAAAGFTARSSPWLEAAESGLALREQLPSDLGSWIGFLLSGAIGAGGILLAGVLDAPVLGLMAALGGGALALTLGLYRLRHLLLRGRIQ